MSAAFQRSPRQSGFCLSLLLLTLCNCICAQTPTAQTKQRLVTIEHIHIALPAEGAYKACVTVASDGSFEIDQLNAPFNSGAWHFTGTLTPDQMAALNASINDRSFVALKTPDPPSQGMVHREGDVLILSVPRDGSIQRLRFQNVDGANPFPPPVASLLPWLKSLDQNKGKGHNQKPTICRPMAQGPPR